jgi:hypothetical protein
MHKKIFSLLILVCLLSAAALAQTAVETEPEDERAEFKEAAAEILGEASAMVPSLASAENRLNYTVRIADLVWDLDASQARAMFQYASDELKREISRVDAALNKMANQPESEWADIGSFSETRNASNRVFQLRTSLVSALANHDAEWASRLLSETAALATNPEFAKRFEQADPALKTTIAGKIAQQDVGKALEIGRERLSKGVSYDVTALLQQIYDKDRKKGIAFGKEVVDKLKASKDSASSWILLGLLRQGSSSLKTAAADKSGNRAPLFDDLTMRDLAGILADSIINSPSRRTSAQALGYIEQYAPQKAPLVKRALDARTGQTDTRRASRRGANGNFSSQSSSWRRANEARSNAQKEIMQPLEGLKAENLSDEERVKLIYEARARILAVADNSFRSANLISLAQRALSAEQDELAASLLSDAERFVNMQPKQRNDFNENRNLAAAYAAVDAEKSFAILENLIFRLNEVIDGFIKMNEFNGNSRAVESGEVVMSSASRQFTGFVSLGGASFQALAEADLERLKNLGDKFVRPEFRVETRLMIAQSLLNPQTVMENQRPRMRGSIPAVSN